MIPSVTYIHLRVQWYLLGPDSPNQRFERELFQSFLASLNSEPATGDYDDFSYRPDRCEFAKVRGSHPQGGQAFSKLVYANDQLTVVEEWAETSAQEFTQKFQGILKAWFAQFPQTSAILERCCLRALVQPANYSDSRSFIGDQVLRLTEHLAESFVRMPHQVGFTVSCIREFPNLKLLIDTKVSSWRDNRSVWVEVGCSAPLERPINATNSDQSQKPFAACQEFLQKEVIGLLAKFDTRGTGGVANGEST